MKLPPNTSDFKNIIENGYYFVDKSLLLKDIFEDNTEVMLFPRPRRFGKTVNLSMLYYFLNQDENQKGEPNLFKNLTIGKDIEFCEKHQGQYPVIFITFKDAKSSSYEVTHAEIKTVIQSSYSKHRYLLDGDVLQEEEKEYFKSILHRKSDDSGIRNSIKQLSEYLYKKYKKKVILLIDEYDTPWIH